MNSDAEAKASEDKSSVTSKRKSTNWILDTKFPNIGSAVGQLTGEKIWSIDSQRSFTVQDRAVYYRCNKTHNNMSPCPVKKCLYFPIDNEEVSLYKTEIKHNHQKSVDKQKNRRRLNRRNLKTNLGKLESIIKIRIVQLMKKIKSPKEMMLRLESEGFNVKNRFTKIRSFYLNYSLRIHKWIFEKSFNGIDEAKMYIRRQQIWSNTFMKHSQGFMNYHYRCGLVPTKGPQCAARKYFSYNKQTNEVILFKKDCPHTHQDIMPRLKLYLSQQTDWLLKQLSKSDRKALKQQDFRILKAVSLRNCLVDNYDICYSWIFEEKFPNEQLALAYLAKDDIWEIDKSKIYTLSDRPNLYFRCNRLRLNGPQCDASKCLLYSLDSKEVSVYKTKSEHTHDQIAELFRKNLQNRFSEIAKQRRVSINKGENINAVKLNNSNHILGKDSHIIPEELVTGNDSVQYVINYLDDDQIICEHDITKYESKWVCKNRFATIEAASNYLEAANLGSFRTLIIQGDRRTYYRCNMVKRSGLQCNVRAYIVRCVNTGKILVYQNIAQITSDQTKHTDILQPESKAEETVMEIDQDNGSKLFGQNNKWNLVDKILSKDMVSSYINTENTWRCKPQNDISSKVFFYCCTKMECKAEMCLNYENLSNEVLVYRSGKHNHGVVYEANDLPLHFNETELIPDSYPNSNIIMKEELIIDAVPVPITKKSCDKNASDIYFEENETKPTNSANNSESNVRLTGILGSNEDGVNLRGSETSTNLNLDNSTESTYEIIISDICNSLSEGELENNRGEEWEYETAFDDYVNAEQYMDRLNLCSFKSVITKSGVKEYYTCKFLDNSVKNCPPSKYLLFKDINSAISMYKTNVRHEDKCTNICCDPISIQRELTKVVVLDDTDESDVDAEEELIIDAVPVPITNKSCDKNASDIYFDENETKPANSANKSESNVRLTGILGSNEDGVNLRGSETSTNLNLDNSTESTYEIIISDICNSLSEGELENNREEEWEYETAFDDYVNAEQYMDRLDFCSFKSVITKSGVKEYYTCKFLDNSVKNCPPSKYLLFKDINSAISMYKTNVRHADKCTNICCDPISIQRELTNVVVLDDTDESDVDAEIILKELDDDENTIFTCIEKIFDTTQEADEYLRNQQIWSFKVRIKTKDGFKEYYRCNLTNACELECDATKLLVINFKSNVISLYTNNENHTHNTLTSAAQAYAAFEKLDNAPKSKMMELILVNEKPKDILEQLKQGFKVPYNDNLFYWINRIRKIRSRHLTNVLLFNTIIENWLSQITKIPKNDDKHFCVDFIIEQSKTFRCFLSTRRLLKNAMRCTLVQIESTCLLQWQHNTISIVGTTDLDQTFHLFGIAICSNAKKRDYEFIFNAIQKGVQKCHKIIFKPKCLISDKNTEIQKAFIKTFGVSGQIHMCSKVALSSIICKLSACVELDLFKKLIECDIRRIQKLSSITLFYNAVDLFFRKWRQLASVLYQFLDYFKTEWVIKNPNWFLGFQQFVPRTKKAIDVEYDSLKNVYTFAQNLPIRELESRVQIEMDKLEKFSRCYGSGGSKRFAYKATVSKSMYKKAADWVQLQKEIKIVQSESETNYYFSAGDEKTICKEKFEKYLACKHQTLEEFFDIQFSFWRVRKGKYSVKFTCNCSRFLENFVCEHSLGMEIITVSNGY